MDHLFQRQFGQGALERINGRGNGGNFQIRRGGAEIGRGVRVEIQLDAVLAGDQALQLQPGAQAALDHAADDLLLKGLGDASAPGAHNAFFVNADVHRDGHVGIARVGYQADLGNAAHGHAAEDHGRADGKAAHRAVKIEHVLEVVAEQAVPGQQNQAQGKETDAAEHKGAHHSFVCL